jgi:hypothetical protein
MTDSILSECRNPVSVPGVPTHIPEDAVVRVELLREAPSEGEDRKPYLRSFEFHLRKATHPDQFPRTRQLMTAAEQDDLENP